MTNNNEIDPQKTNRYLVAILSSSKHLKLHNSNIDKVIKNITWLLIDKVLHLGIGLLVGAWVARYLGPADFGEISYIIAFVGIFQTLSQLGINNIAVRELSIHKELTKEIIGTLFRLRIFSAVFCFVSTVCSFYLINTENRNTFLISIIISATLILRPSEVIDLWFQSELKSKRTVFAKLTSNIISNTIKVIFILLQMPLIAFAAVSFIEAAIFTLVLLHLYRKHSMCGYGLWNLDLCKKMITEGAPFLLSSLLLVAYIQFDKVLIAKIGNATEAGYYAVAITLTSIFNVLPMIICTSLAPLIANLATEKERFDFFTKLYSALFWAATVFSFLLFFFSEKIIFLLYGSLYHSSILVTKILASSIIPVFMSVANDYLALNKKASKVTLARTIIGLITCLTLSIILIPQYGAIGAAIAITIAHWMSNTILYWLVLREALLLQTKGLAIPLYFLIKKLNLK